MKRLAVEPVPTPTTPPAGTWAMAASAAARFSSSAALMMVTMSGIR